MVILKKEYYAAKKDGHYYNFGSGGDISSAELVKQSLYARRVYALSAADFIGGEVVPVHLVEVAGLDDKQVSQLLTLMTAANENNDPFNVLLTYVNQAEDGDNRELAVVQAFVNEFAKLK